MRQTAEAEQTARRAERQAEIDRLAARRTRCRDLRRELVALFSETNEQRRGTALR